MKNWSLSKKIWAVLSLLIFAFVGNVYMALSRMDSIRNAMNEITTVFVKRDQMTSDIQDNQRLMSLSTRDVILESNDEKTKIVKKTFDDLLEKQNKTISEYEAIASEQGKAILKKYVADRERWLVEVRKVQALALLQKDKEATDALFGTSNILQSMRGYLTELTDLTAKRLADKSAEANSIATQAIWLCLILSVVSIFVSIAIGFYVLRAATQSIGEVVKNLFYSSAQVSSAANQIASSSEELSQAATEQAASLEETAASIQEMNSMVAKNSENAESTASTSGKSQEKAAEGKAVVEKMIHSMDAINQSNNTIMEQVNRSNDSMAGIVKVIEEIESKTKVINDIVFQTKLLSFNASVEAARAGEHGKGFAVVAEEVGNLAQMSGNAAKEISALLGESVQKVNQIVQETKSGVEKLIEEGKETVANGTQVARHCGEVLEELVHNVSSVSSMAGEIAAASQEQSRGVDEITKAMSQLDQMTQQNAATSEECASSAEELSAQSEALKNAVSQLVRTVNGSDGDAAASSLPTAEAQRPVARKAHPVKTPQNVVQLKSSKAPLAPRPQSFKKAVGDVPSHNSDGFEDV